MVLQNHISQTISDAKHLSPHGSKEVATKKPNAFGLCDMQGNIFEWTGDWRGCSYPQSNGERCEDDPSRTYRVGRGGIGLDIQLMNPNFVSVMQNPTIEHIWISFGQTGNPSVVQNIFVLSFFFIDETSQRKKKYILR